MLDERMEAQQKQLRSPKTKYKPQQYGRIAAANEETVACSWTSSVYMSGPIRACADLQRTYKHLLCKCCTSVVHARQHLVGQVDLQVLHDSYPSSEH